MLRRRVRPSHAGMTVRRVHLLDVVQDADRSEYRWTSVAEVPLALDPPRGGTASGFLSGGVPPSHSHVRVGDKVRVLWPSWETLQPPLDGVVAEVNRRTDTHYVVETTESVFDPVHDTFRRQHPVKDSDVLLLPSDVPDRQRAVRQALLCLRADINHALEGIAKSRDPKDILRRFWRRASAYDDPQVRQRIDAAMTAAFGSPRAVAPKRSLPEVAHFVNLIADIDPEDPMPGSER